MIEVPLIFDVGPPGGTVGAVAGVFFFLICIAVAFIAFRLLRKTLKMALRLIIVFVIIAIGLFGTAAWYFMGSGGHGPQKPRPGPSRER